MIIVKLDVYNYFTSKVHAMVYCLLCVYTVMHVRVCVCVYRPLFIVQHNGRHNNNVNLGQKCPLDRKVVVMFIFDATLPSNRHFMSAFTDSFGFIHMGVQSYLLDTGCTIPQLMSCIMEVPPSLSPPPPLSLSLPVCLFLSPSPTS